MRQNPYTEVIFDERQIKAGASKIAQTINEHFSSVVAITVVPGGMIFTSDLVRMLSIDVKMDYISCPHIPGDRTNNSEIKFFENVSLHGQDVLLIDDAIESGGTMARLVEYISQGYDINSLATATLFVKKNRRDIPVKQYYAFELGSDDILIGYGLPWQDKYRNMPFVAKLGSG